MHRTTVLTLTAATFFVGTVGVAAREPLEVRLPLPLIRVAATAAAEAVENSSIESVISDSIGWAQTKDRPRLESIIAHDPELFMFQPVAGTDVHGWDDFAKQFEFWMDPRFVATRFEIRDLRVTRSRSGDVAWFSALLDDCGEWDGTPFCWNDTRWTGVLEERDGRWLIVQMHFSFARSRDPQPAAADGETTGP